MLVGVFIGSLLRAIDPSSVRLNFQITGFTIVIGLMVAVIVGFLVAAAFTGDYTRRNEFFAVSGIGFLAFIFVSFFGGLLSGALENQQAEKQQLTITEFNALAERALQNKDFERALMHLRTIENRVRGDKARLKLIQEKIRQIELQELK